MKQRKILEYKKSLIHLDKIVPTLIEHGMDYYYSDIDNTVHFISFINEKKSIFINYFRIENDDTLNHYMINVYNNLNAGSIFTHKTKDYKEVIEVLIKEKLLTR